MGIFLFYEWIISKQMTVPSVGREPFGVQDRMWREFMSPIGQCDRILLFNLVFRQDTQACWV